MTSAAEVAHVESIRDASGPEMAFVAGGFQDPSAPDYSEPAGGWQWVTGEDWDFTNWGVVEGADQPDNAPGDASVLGVRWQEDGVWCDVPSGTQWGAVFEWSADCDGDGVVDYGEILDGTHEDLDGNGIPDCCDEGVACHPITVDDDGPADYSDIQSALEASEEGDEVLVMPGTYTSDGGEVINFPGHPVTLRSAGGAEHTIIDGEGIRRGIVTSWGGSDIVVEGFTVRNCETAGGGGGILCGTGVNITFRDMVIEDNYAGAEGGGANLGGAGTVVMESCRFVRNVAGNGGGLHMHDSQVSLSGCRFAVNEADGAGGAIHHGSASGLTIADTSFCSNAASGADDIAGNWDDAGGNTFDDCPCSSDFDGSGSVDVGDLLTVVAWWGSAGPLGDANGDGTVDVTDLLIAMEQWGTCEIR